jgi:putative oxidoreductase
LEQLKTDEQDSESPPLRLWRWATASGGDTARDFGLLLLRATGLLMMQHGWGKLMSYSERADSWADPIGLGPELSLALAIGAEFLCAILVAVGFATRLAAIPLAFTMLVAITVVHWDDPFGKKEFALLYLVPFLTLILTGAGRYSVDGWLARRRSN